MRALQKTSDWAWRKVIRLVNQKASRLFPHLFYEWEEDRGISADPDAENYARTYSAASWVYACVRLIAETCGSVPLRFYKKVGDEVEEVTKGRAVDVFSRPNPFIGIADLLEGTVSHLLLNGNAYWSIEDEEEPMEIFPIRPEKIKIIPSKTDFIAGYRYRNNGNKIDFSPEEMFHFKFFHATDDYYGLSPLAVARRVLIMDFHAVNSNISMFKNQHRPGGLLQVEGNMEEAQYKRLKKDWKKMHQGTDKWHGLAILEGGTTWKETALSPKDIEFILSRKMNREEICAVFKVPPAVVGIFEYANYANSKEQMKMFWQHCIVPILQKLASVINQRILPWIEVDIFCEFDLSDISVLKSDEKTVMEVITGYVDRNVITINEARKDYLNLPPVKWGDDPQKRTLPALVSELGVIGSRPPDQKVIVHDKKIEATEEEIKLWKAFDEALILQEDPFKKKIAKFLDDQKGRILRAFSDLPENWLKGLKKKNKRKLEKGQKINLTEADLDLIFDMIKENGFLEKLSLPFLSAIIGLIGQQNMIQLDVGFDFNPLHPDIESWVRMKILKFVRSVNRTTRKELADLIAAALEEEYTMQDISQQISDHLNRRRDYRSDRIARTEVLGYHNKGIWEAYKQSGVVKKKKWLATMDGRVRDSHGDLWPAGAHRQIVGIDDFFRVGEALLMFPGDMSDNHPEEVINCRCTLTAAEIEV